MAVDSTGLRDVLDTIRDFAVALTVNRLSNEDVVNGHVISSNVAVANVLGHMQPLSPKEYRYVPEGSNTLEWWHIWSLSELKEGDRVTDGSAPVVTVQRIEVWKEAPFWHAQGVVVTDDISLPPVTHVGAGDVLAPAPTGVGLGSHP